MKKIEIRFKHIATMKSTHLFFFNFLLIVLCCQWCSCYIEKRTFRERANIFCRLKKQCKQYEEWEDDYKRLIKISDVAGAQPDGYLVRFPFYVVAERNANIVFAEIENPDWFVDNVYEIVFGDWENKRTTLRRKRAEEELIFTYTDEILTPNCPLKMLIEITTAGDIRVYLEHELKPIIDFNDPNLLQIKYFGFSSWGQSLARFFYDCHGDEVYTESQLTKSCQRIDTASSEHTKFNRIPDNSITESDYELIELPFFVTAQHDAHILLSASNSFDAARHGYEIVIGDDENRRVSIQKIEPENTTILADYRRADIILKNETLTALIKLSKRGKIDLFTKHDHTQFKLLASVKDPKYTPIQLKYVSFASYNNTPIKFFYDCSFLPPYIDTQSAIKYATPGHPLLLSDPKFSTPVDKRNWLTSRCKYYTNTKYEYKHFFPLSNIRDSQPNGYQARLEFYAQGTRNAHVLLSRSATPNLAVDNVYEFIIGGWVNSRVLIRRKKSDQVLHQVFVPPILSGQSPTKFVIEVANSGFIRIFVESNKIEPIATVYDPLILPVKFVSFCAYDNLVRFYYDCGGNRE